MNRDFTKSIYTWVMNLLEHSTLFISHREIEIKMTMRYCYTFVRMAEVKKSTIPSAVMRVKLKLLSECPAL